MSYYCHNCQQDISPNVLDNSELVCPLCQEGFIEQNLDILPEPRVSLVDDQQQEEPIINTPEPSSSLPPSPPSSQNAPIPPPTTGSILADGLLYTFRMFEPMIQNFVHNGRLQIASIPILLSPQGRAVNVTTAPSGTPIVPPTVQTTEGGPTNGVVEDSPSLASNLRWAMPIIRQILESGAMQDFMRSRGIQYHVSTASNTDNEEEDPMMMSGSPIIEGRRRRPRSASMNSEQERSPRSRLEPSEDPTPPPYQFTFPGPPFNEPMVSGGENEGELPPRSAITFTFTSTDGQEPIFDFSPIRNVFNQFMSNRRPENTTESVVVTQIMNSINPSTITTTTTQRGGEPRQQIFQSFEQPQIIHGTDIADMISQAISTLFSGQLGGIVGDYAIGPNAFDNIISQLLDQEAMRHAPLPATEETINSLPRCRIAQQHLDRTSECSICKDDFALNDLAVEIPCHHIFHEECVIPWLKKNGTCPVCRYSLLNNGNGASPPNTTTSQASDQSVQASPNDNHHTNE